MREYKRDSSFLKARPKAWTSLFHLNTFIFNLLSTPLHRNLLNKYMRALIPVDVIKIRYTYFKWHSCVKNLLNEYDPVVNSLSV